MIQSLNAHSVSLKEKNEIENADASTESVNKKNSICSFLTVHTTGSNTEFIILNIASCLQS